MIGAAPLVAAKESGTEQAAQEQFKRDGLAFRQLQPTCGAAGLIYAATHLWDVALRNFP